MNRNKIELTDNVMEILVKMSEGNPGALNAMGDILKNHQKIDPQAMLGGMGLILAFDDMGIYGTDIYVLYSDKCEKNLRKLCVLMRVNQLGFLSSSKVLEMAKDQRRQINLSEEEFTELDKKVCEQLEDFQKPKSENVTKKQEKVFAT